jgi:hypothetical protein
VARRSIFTLALLSLVALVVLVASPAEGRDATVKACGSQAYAYAGLQSGDRAHGVEATVVALRAPTVADGHVAGWIGVGGVDAGPGGKAEWLQAGLASFAPDTTSRLYYEVTVAGAAPRYVQLAPVVRPGEARHLAVLEMSRRPSWWRVWVDGHPWTQPIYLPGSHGSWYPQAIAESWNGGTGACNSYAYRFANVKLARENGGVWRTLRSSSVFQDPGYRVVQTSHVPRTFLAARAS